MNSVIGTQVFEFKLKFGNLQKICQFTKLNTCTSLNIPAIFCYSINCPVGSHGAILICSVEHTQFL